MSRFAESAKQIAPDAIKIAALCAVAITLTACGLNSDQSEQDKQAEVQQVEDFAARINAGDNTSATKSSPSQSNINADGNTSPAAKQGNQIKPMKGTSPTNTGRSRPLNGGVRIPSLENSAEQGAAGTLNDDPATSNCNVPKVALFFGRKSDDLTKRAIFAAIAPQTQLRFVGPEDEFQSDPSSNRLNMMIDNNGIIRDAICG